MKQKGEQGSIFQKNGSSIARRRNRYWEEKNNVNTHTDRKIEEEESNILQVEIRQ